MMSKKQQTVITEKETGYQPPSIKSEAKQELANTTSHSSSSQQKKKTQVIINYDIGLNNVLYIRGNFNSLKWDRGVILRNTKADEWIWETDATFKSGEFKVLINDVQYESGPNRTLNSGDSIKYTPSFN